MDDCKELEALLLSFMVKLKTSSQIWGERTTEDIEAGYWLKEYIKHFNIKIENKGKIV